jgi:glycosyl hydrolase family 123
MTRRNTVMILALIAAATLGAAETGSAQQSSAAKSSPVMVLHDFSSWRIFQTLRPPVVEDGQKLTAYERPQRWLNRETSEVAPAWQQNDFDDSDWVRGSTRLLARSAYLSRGCLRARFQVADPAKVRGLKLSVGYHGGLIVTLNGKPLLRRHLPNAAPQGKPLLAESYPLECHVKANGDLLAVQNTRLAKQKRSGKPTADSVERMKKRNRRVEAFAIPSPLLQRGTNVLAIEVVRSPYHKVMLEDGAKVGKCRINRFDWYSCQLIDVAMVADSAEGLVPNTGRPEGLQVWNSDPANSDTDMDWGDPLETLQPIRLVGARNGAYSGKVVLGSTQAIAALKVAPSLLRSADDDSTIAASAVRIRYALPGVREIGKSYGHGPFPSPYRRTATILSHLATEPLAEFPVAEKRASHPNDPPLAPPVASAAVVPVWVTVTVPKDARPGDYAGTVTVSAKGEKPICVPVTLTVLRWTLPDPQNYRTWLELIQSPDTLAVEYGVPLWSEEHWKLIAQSMRYLNEIGSRVVYVPLLAQTNWGNAESMVRWIEKPGGKFDYDFTIMDRYLDLADEVMGTPKAVIFNVWDIYMIPKPDNPTRGGHGRMIRWMRGNKSERGKGPLVTFLDPKTEKTECGELPTHFEARSKALWAPLMKKVMARMKKRRLLKQTMIGVFTDSHPSKEEVQLFADIAPGVPWVSEGHGGYRPGHKLHGIATVGYQTCVWYTQFTNGVPTHGKTWPEKSLYGWKQEQLTVAFERNGGLVQFSPTRWRHMGETNITGGQRGMGRIAGDYWPVIKDRRGRRVGTVTARFPSSIWMNLNICNPVLAPGPTGPVATTQFEWLREGIQECEARIAIERALTDEKLRGRLGAPLVKRSEKALDERIQIMWKSLSNHQLGSTMFFKATAWRWTPGVMGHTWYLGSPWQERSRLLYNLADEVTRKTRSRR